MRTSTLLSGLVLSLVASLPAAPAQAEEAAPAAPPAAAAAQDVDVIELTDGRRLTGEIVGEDDRFVSLRAGGVLRAYPRTKVASITRAERTEAPLPPPISGTETKKDARKRAKKAAKTDKKAGASSTELSAEARTWLLGLLDRARSDAAQDPAVRKSLSSAIQALGPAALADIKAVADSAGPESRELLDRIAKSIEQKAAKRAQPERKRKAAGETAARESARAGTPGMGDSGTESDRAVEKARSPREKLMDLGMTPEQGLEMREILEVFGAAAREIYMSIRDGSLPRADARAEMADLRTTTVASIRQVLDPTQLAEFETFSDELLDPRKKRRPGKKRKKDAPKARE